MRAAGLILTLGAGVLLWSQADQVAALRQARAEDQAKLQRYSWVETRELKLDGQVTSRIQSNCKYGEDGEIVRDPVGSGQGRQLSGRRAQRVTEYMDRAVSLTSRYAPPDVARIEEAVKDGRASANGSRLEIEDYAKTADLLTLEFDASVPGRLRTLQARTWLDNRMDVVILMVRYDTLPDGATYPAEITITAPQQKLEMKTVNFSFRALGE